MTEQLIKRFAQEHNISTIRSMVLLYELLGQKKDPATTESSKDCIPEFSIEQLGW